MISEWILLNSEFHTSVGLQVIELFGNGFYSGDLGPSTIVGVTFCRDILGVTNKLVKFHRDRFPPGTVTLNGGEKSEKCPPNPRNIQV